MRHYLAALLLAPAAPASAQSTADVEHLRVQDGAKMLPSSEQVELIRESEALEKATTDQLVVVTVPTLSGRDITEYSTALGNQLGVGQADKDNGVLLVVAPNEKKVRVAVGYGLEGLLTNQRAGRIVQDMLPYFRSGNGPQAVRIGVQEIGAILRSDLRRPQYLRKAA